MEGGRTENKKKQIFVTLFILINQHSNEALSFNNLLIKPSILVY